MDVIIMTCVRANKKGKIGFVEDEKRMNVSITRAKYCLFVFGHSKTLSSDSLWRSYMDYHDTKNSHVWAENM